MIFLLHVAFSTHFTTSFFFSHFFLFTSKIDSISYLCVYETFIFSTLLYYCVNIIFSVYVSRLCIRDINIKTVLHISAFRIILVRKKKNNRNSVVVFFSFFSVLLFIAVFCSSCSSTRIT